MTMQTITHRGVFIHISLTGIRVNSPINGYSEKFSTIRAAKLACTRIVKAIAKGSPVAYPHHMQEARQ